MHSTFDSIDGFRSFRSFVATRAVAATLIAGGLAVAGLSAVSPATAAPGKTTAAPTATRTGIVASARPVATTPVRLSATISPRPTAGTVTFRSAGKVLLHCSARPVSAGRASCVTRFARPGAKTIVARYSGTRRYAASSRTMTLRVTKAVGTVVGGVGACTTSKGALVGVDFAHWGAPIVRGCDTTATNGVQLLTGAGFTTTLVRGQPFICRIGSPLANGGAQYPTASQDACVRTPPASAYWSYWTALKGVNSWTYSTKGAYSDTPRAGEVEAWTFGDTDVSGTTGKPSFTPNQLRAGLPTGTSTATARSVARKATVARQANLAAAVAYLTGQLTDATHYEQFTQPDLGLTLDGALALAGAGTNDAALAKVVDYLAEHVGDYTFLGTTNEQYADGGSIGKVALLAEATGHDPRNFGGHDLITALSNRVCTAVNGDCVAAGNYQGASSVFKQSFGLIAQLRAGDAAATPTTYLESLQHGDGAFPSLIPGNDSDVDSTAMAAMALSLVSDSAAESAVSKAIAWLATKQNADGGFTGTAGNSINTAALAVQGLSLGGSTYRAEIDKAQSFLASAQNRDGGFPVSAGTDQTDSDVRASTQAVSGVVATSLATVRDDITVAPAQVDENGAADYLVGQLVDGNHLEYAGGFGANYGGTADLAFALAANGKHDAVLKNLVRYLIAHVGDYADPAGTGQFPGPYSGSLGKLAVLAESTGQDPNDFGGFDLLKTLTDHVCTAADQAGSCTAPGDFYQAFSTVSQAFGVLALARAEAPIPAAALGRLESLQCLDGGFSSELITPGAKCTSDVDTTGYAVQALSLVGSAAPELQRAVAYLRTSQQGDGGWNGAAGENTNSTALAVQGLLAAPAAADARTSRDAAQPRATQSDPAVKSAIVFLAGLQNSNGGFGISAASKDSDVLATTQAVPAIEFTPLSRLVHAVDLAVAPSGPTTAPPSTTTGSATDSVPPSSSADTTDSSGVAGSSTSPGAGGLANTGAPARSLLGYAIVLLLIGATLAYVGRRRRIGRHSW